MAFVAATLPQFPLGVRQQVHERRGKSGGVRRTHKETERGGGALTGPL